MVIRAAFGELTTRDEGRNGLPAYSSYMKTLPPDLIAKLLKDDEKTPQAAAKQPLIKFGNGRSLTKPQGPWRYVENSRKCVSTRCGVETWMLFDGIPYCTVHGLKYLNDKVIELTKRLTPTHPSRATSNVTVFGDLFGNEYEEDKLSEQNDEQRQNDGEPQAESDKPMPAGEPQNPEVANDDSVEAPEHSSAATTGNQSDEEVAEIQAGERPEGDEAP